MILDFLKHIDVHRLMVKNKYTKYSGSGKILFYYKDDSAK